MEVTFNFKYKDTSIFSNGQTSGFIANCINPPAPEKGDKGKNGSMLYITDYYIDNTYDKNLCLENIENNILPTSNGKKLEGRVYVPGDLFVSPTREIFKLVYAPEGSKYKYDLKYLGMIKKDRKFNIIDYINSITLAYKTSLERCMVPVNRGMDSSVNDCTFVSILDLTEENDHQLPPDIRIKDILSMSSNDIYFNGITDASLYYSQWDIDRHFRVIGLSDDSSKLIVLSSPMQLGDSYDFYNTDWGSELMDEYPKNNDSSQWYQFICQFSSSAQTDPDHRYTFEDAPINVRYTKSGQPNDGLIIATDKYERTLVGYTYKSITFQTNIPDLMSGTGVERRFNLADDPSKYILLTQSAEVKQISNGIGLSYISPLYEKGLDWDASNNLSTAVSYKDAYRGMYGIKIVPIIHFKNNLPLGFDPSNYEFYMRIYVYNTKRFQNGNFPLRREWSDEFRPYNLRYTEKIKKRKEPITKENNSDLNFYKCIEFPLINGYSNNDSSYYPIYISDYVADKIHPSGNNICVSFQNDGRNQKYIFDSSTYYWTRFVYDPSFYSLTQDNYRLDAIYDSGKMWDFQVINFYNLFYDTYRSNHALIQYYKFPVNDYEHFSGAPFGKPYVDYRGLDSSHLVLSINYRGGESAFFSGMTLPRNDSSILGNDFMINGNNLDSDYNSYISYLKLANINDNNVISSRINLNGNYIERKQVSAMLEYNTKEHVARNIKNYIFYPGMFFNSDSDRTINDFEVICIDKRTRESIVLHVNNLINIYEG